MYYVDLNSDLGESFGNYTIGWMRKFSSMYHPQTLHAAGTQAIRL